MRTEVSATNNAVHVTASESESMDTGKMLSELIDSQERLLEENRELREALREVEAYLQKRDDAPRNLGVYIADGPPLTDGSPSILVDTGGRRILVGFDPKFTLEEVKRSPFLILDPQTAFVIGLYEHTHISTIMRVKEVYEDSILVEDKMEMQSRVDVAASLLGSFQAGERAFVSNAHGLAVGRLPAEETPSEWLLEAAPKERFRDIGAQSHSLELIEERLFGPLMHPHIVESLGLARSAGILLYGPSGTRLTLLLFGTSTGILFLWDKSIGGILLGVSRLSLRIWILRSFSSRVSRFFLLLFSLALYSAGVMLLSNL